MPNNSIFAILAVKNGMSFSIFKSRTLRSFIVQTITKNNSVDTTDTINSTDIESDANQS